MPPEAAGPPAGTPPAPVQPGTCRGRDAESGVCLVNFLVNFLDARQQFLQHPQMRVPAVHLFFQNHAVKTLARRLGQQFFRERNVFLARKAKAVDDPGDLRFGILNAFGNLHLLLARQQRHLSHLVQIHPHRIVQNIQPRRVFLLAFRLLEIVHLGLVNDFNLERPQFGKNFVQLFGRRLAVRQSLADVVVSELPLFLRQTDQFLDLLRNIRGDARLKNGGRSVDGFQRLNGGNYGAAPSLFRG